jgi:GDPmannose 4,6-dehydratase
MVKKALIFGATGQDASYLAELLLSKGYEVVAVKRRTSTNNTERLSWLQATYGSHYELIEGDVTDAISVYQIIDKYRPDECYNTAAQSHVHTSFEQPVYTFKVNTTGELYILEALRKYAPNCHHYFCGTSEAWGNSYSVGLNGHRYQDETTPFEPASPYAASKVAAIHLLRNYRESYNMFACVGLLHNHESPRRGYNFVTRKITRYIGKVANGLTISKLALGNIDAMRDWFHAKDAVRAMWMMLQNKEPVDYVVGAGEAHTVRDFLKIAFDYGLRSNYEDSIYLDKSLLRPSDVEFLQSKPDKIKKELGWQPEYTFEQLVTEMVDADKKYYASPPYIKE